mgnify:FL=1|tara:strand:- start:20456 stop:21511 length:1056 start_codon:yes stop_codon:yes gene_type:complete
MSLNLEPFFDISLDLLCIAGFDGYFKKINPAFIKLLEYPEEELFSKKISEFIYEEDRDLTAGFRENIKRNIPLLNFENRYVSKSGKLIWLQWTSIPLSSENLVYAIAKNITHKKELDKERSAHLFKLDKKNQDLKNLNYKTSHDLRSPVNNLLTLYNLLDFSKITDDQTIKILGFIRLSTQGLKKSLDDYMDSLALADKQESKLELVKFDSVLTNVKSSISAIIEDSNAEFTCDFSEMESVSFNKAYMESIFLNFITNSIKYARPDVLPKMKIIAKEEAGKKKLIYTDNGLGFDMEAVSGKIFNLNQRFHDNKDSKGVGLYLVHNHVTNLGGTVTLDSKVNEGATFTITFK